MAPIISGDTINTARIYKMAFHFKFTPDENNPALNLTCRYLTQCAASKNYNL